MGYTATMHRKHAYALLALVLLAAATLALSGVVLLREQHPHEFTVAFLDVGQGDAIFIESPSGTQMLIDGGRDARVLRELPRVMPFWDRSLDVVLATHPDEDHIGGLIDALTRFRVSHVFRPGVASDTPAARSFLQEVASEGVTETLARRGQIIDLGEGVFVEVLFPDRDVSGMETNAASVAVRIVYGDTAFLLTGDAPAAIEEYLVALDGDGERLKSDVLKAGHHGSRTSSSELLLGYADPTYAVFSRGCDNRYGHPHEDVVARYARFGIETFDTCEDGTVVFRSDGVSVTTSR